jgi:Pyruvate/2-oxoacid:ferredoxin oxidoreductase delta subunit
MSRNRVTVVISQAQGKNPLRRALEESLAATLLMEPGVDLSIVPHLYDLEEGHTGRLFLNSVSGDMIVLGWLFPRAGFWLLDRMGVKGLEGSSPMHPVAEDDGEDAGESEPQEKAPAIGQTGDIPDRTITLLDLRAKPGYEPYLEEVRRLIGEAKARREASTLARPPVLVELGLPKPAPVIDLTTLATAPAARRWYPVIDYSRCTNCMQCLDFCLFGVYGVDGGERILVESQDNCKKGCPACSRVCPEQAIMFPEYKTPAIAGAPVGVVTGLKIDLSKLFGGGDPSVTAAAERDRELVKDGRDAVGLTVGMAPRRAPRAPTVPDELDGLVDALDKLEI